MAADSTALLPRDGVHSVNGGDSPQQYSGSSSWAAYCWLLVFTGTGVLLGVSFELLDTHAGPARSQTFFLAFVGYWAQFIVAGIYVACTGTWRGAKFGRNALLALVLSALFDGAGQALDYVGQMMGGYTLFTIFHASVTLFACVLAAATPLRARPTALQWLGALLIVAGLLVTAFPHPIRARVSFGWAILTSLLGSFSLAASYPVSELVFKYGGAKPVSEEVGCFCGSLFNVVAFSLWTFCFTIPRWDEMVVEPIHKSAYPCADWSCAAGYYSLFGLMVGLHSLSFWKSVRRLGTVATAVSKGAQQSGIFVVAHLCFCASDPTECLWHNGGGGTAWSKMQKPVACAVCIAGVVVFVLGKNSLEEKTLSNTAAAQAVLGVGSTEPVGVVAPAAEGDESSYHSRHHEQSRGEALPARTGGE